MSYNIMKKRAGFAGATNGTIENIVDTHTVQTVGGSKTFTSTITSSANTMLSGAGDVSASFYHGDGRYLTNITASHIALSNGPTGSIQFHNSGGQISGSGNFKFLTSSNTVAVNGHVSASGNISASFFYGDGRYLTNIPTSSISGQFNASQIAHASPLTNSAGVLDVKILSQGGIQDSNGLRLKIKDLTTQYSSYNDADFLVIETAVGNIEKVNLSFLENNMEINASNLAGTINNLRLPANISVNSITASSHISSSTYYGDGSNLTGITATGGSAAAQGPIGSLQFHTGSGGISGSANILFLTSSNTLLIDGGVSASLGELEETRVTDLTFLGSGFNYPVETAAAQASGVTLIVSGGADFRNDVEISGETTVTRLTASAYVSASIYYGDGSNLTGITASAGGAPAQGPIGSIQFHTGSGGMSGSANILFLTSSNTLVINGDVSASLSQLEETRVTDLTFLGSGFNYPVETTVAQANGTTLIVSGGVDFRNDLQVSGETTVTRLTASAYVSASTYYGDGSNLTGITASAGGASAQGPIGALQFHTGSGGMSGSANILFLTSSNTLAVDGDVSASFYFGDGRHLKNIATSNLSGTISNASLPAHISVTYISASSHISSSAFVGDGSQLTNLSVSTFTRTEITSSTYSVLTSDYYVGVNFTGSGGSTLSLPNAAAMNSGQTVIIKDESGTAGTNNIIINAGSGETIDGQTSQTIESNYGAISLYSNGIDKYFIF